jgi:D-arginine dehydrogenase
VVGGGIAGVAAAHFLAAAGASVVVAEAEPQLAHHSTGRSAAQLIGNYGTASVRPLTVASRPFLEDPGGGPTGLAELVDSPLLDRRPVLTVADRDRMDRLAAQVEAGRAGGVDVSLIGPDEAAAHVPCLSLDWIAGASWEPDTYDIDVAGLHQAFVRGVRRRGGTILTSAPITSLAPLPSGPSAGWRATAGPHELTAGVVVNAAGAWGDEVAARAGVRPVGLEPRRRSVFMVAGRPEWRSWPLVADVDHLFYFKPDGPQLLCSPADQTPVPPHDARPDETAVALAIDRINAATTLDLRSVRSSWAGLRTFAPDESMVVGPDPDATGFVWLVGQGGTGIQTAPAAGMLAVALALGDPVPPALTAAGLDLAALLPDRLR